MKRTPMTRRTPLRSRREGPAADREPRPMARSSTTGQQAKSAPAKAKSTAAPHSGSTQQQVLKAKACAHCGREFLPARPLQAVCRQLCAERMVRAQAAAKKAKERAETRERKEAIKRLPDLHREAQAAFNAWIRERDAVLPCISCGAPPPDLSELHAGRDAGHYRSVGSAAHLRYHEDNVHGQCVACNQWGAGRAVEYRIGLIARIGLARVDALEVSNEPHKWTREEVRATRDLYRQKLKALKKEHA